MRGAGRDHPDHHRREAADTTWRELTTIRIVDDVIPTMRAALRAKFHRAKNTEQSRGAIRSQVVLELENRKRAGDHHRL